MGRIYFIGIYLLAMFCGGCAVTEMFMGQATVLGVFLIAAGMGLLFYTIRLIQAGNEL